MIHYIRWLYWKYQYWHACDFAAGLEKTIASERRKAREAVEHEETMARRTEIEYGISRATR